MSAASNREPVTRPTPRSVLLTATANRT